MLTRRPFLFLAEYMFYFSQKSQRTRKFLFADAHSLFHTENTDQTNERMDSQPTNEARAEAKLVWTLPCKEEENEVNLA